MPLKPVRDLEIMTLREAFALINTLDAEQQKQAILGSSYIDLVLGSGHDDKTIRAEGIQVSSLNADQQKLLLDLVSVRVNMLSADDTAVKMAEVEAQPAPMMPIFIDSSVSCRDHLFHAKHGLGQGAICPTASCCFTSAEKAANVWALAGVSVAK